MTSSYCLIMTRCLNPTEYPLGTCRSCTSANEEGTSSRTKERFVHDEKAEQACHFSIHIYCNVARRFRGLHLVVLALYAVCSIC